jgi:hypothetical protein
LQKAIASKRYVKRLVLLIKLYVVVESLRLYVQEFKYRLLWRERVDLALEEPPIHSVYLSDALWTPHYTMMHRPGGNPIKIYTAD